MNQEAFVDLLVQATDLNNDVVNCPDTPYCSGLPVDKINTPLHNINKTSYCNSCWLALLHGCQHHLDPLLQQLPT